MKENPRKSRAHLKKKNKNDANVSLDPKKEDDRDSDVEIVFWTRATPVCNLTACAHVRNNSSI